MGDWIVNDRYDILVFSNGQSHLLENVGWFDGEFNPRAGVKR